MSRQKGSSSGNAGAYVFVGVALALSFGAGYRVGRDANTQQARPAGVSPEVKSPVAVPPPARPSATPRAMMEPRAELPRSLWMAVGKPAFTLYLSSFQSLGAAEKEMSRLDAKGLKGIEIAERRAPGPAGQTWYRLRYGQFESMQAAVDRGRQLVDRGWIRDFWPKEML